MKFDFCNAFLREQLKNKDYCVLKNKFLKKVQVGTSLETVYFLDKNKHKLTKQYYSFIEKIYMEYGYSYILESDYLKNYRTLQSVLENINLNKKKIVLSCQTAIYELRELGVDYWDLSPENIMINKKEDIKIVDLSDAILTNHPLYCNYSLMELILKLYLFYGITTTNKCMNMLLNFEEVHDYFSDKFLRYLLSVANLEDVALPLEDILKAFEDDEKVNELRKKLCRERSRNFVEGSFKSNNF